MVASYFISKSEFIQEEQRNCNSEYGNYGRQKPNPENKEGELAFIGRRGSWEGL